MRRTMFAAPVLWVTCLAGAVWLVAEEPSGGNEGIGRRAPSRPYLTTDSTGQLYARAVPPHGREAGSTKIYRVADQADELIDEYPWYAEHSPRSLVILAVGFDRQRGRDMVAVFRPHNERDPQAGNRQPEFGIYLGGKPVRTWTTGDLRRLGASVENDKGQGRMPAGDYAQYRFNGYSGHRPEKSEYGCFSLLLGDRPVLVDIATGEAIKEPSGPPAKLAPGPGHGQTAPGEEAQPSRGAGESKDLAKELAAGQEAIFQVLKGDAAAWRVEAMPGNRVGVVFTPAAVGLVGFATLDSATGKAVDLEVTTHAALEKATARLKAVVGKAWVEPSQVGFGGRKYVFWFPTDDAKMKVFGPSVYHVPIGPGEPYSAPQR